jgi:sodium-dependent dicarboxylate transporter 2/3/5
VTGRKFAAALAAFGIAWLIPGLPPAQRAVAATFAASVVLWVSEGLPLAVTALLSTALLILLGVVPVEKAFLAYGDPVIILFIGSFVLAKGMEISRLDRRLAFLLLRYRWATRTPARLMLSLGVLSAVISMFVSNTAVAAMLLPIGLGLLAAMGVQVRGAPYAVGVLLMLTWGASVGGVGTIVGTPPNLITLSHIQQAAGRRVGFLEWMTFGVPLMITMLAGCWLLLRFLYGKNPPPAVHTSETAAAELRAMGALAPAERNTMVAFFTTLTLWLLPGALDLILGPLHRLTEFATSRLDAPVAALIGAALLFFLPARGAPEGRTLTWQQAATIDWGTVLLFGGGIALGRAMFDSGLAATVGRAAAAVAGTGSLWAVTAVATVLAIALSELASNTASAATIVPLAIGLALGAGVDPVAPALGAGLGASFGFMLPSARRPMPSSTVPVWCRPGR